MRSLLIAALILSVGIMFAVDVQECQTSDNLVTVRLNNFKSCPDPTAADPNLSVTAQTYALPYQQAQIQVNGMTWKEYDASGNYLRTIDLNDNQKINLVNSFTFREMRGFTVTITNQYTENNVTRVLQNIEFRLIGSQPITIPEAISPSFVTAYSQLATNYNTSYLRNLPLSRPGLLIISHASVTDYLSNFIAWKKAKGFDVYVANLSSIGNTAIAIRNFVQTHYNQYHCDHLLLLGDVTGSYALPTHIYTSPDGTEQDADDNFYTMVAGDDYFPEMLSGRFSFGDISELLTMLNKTILYEKTPYLSNPNWMRRSLVVAGNYAEGGLRPVTPYQMSMWLREKMLAKGYTAVDTVFYTLENPTVSGASLIQASINQGVQYISYRGWGAADGWHYPSFHNVDLNSSLINGAKMPVVFSIVCNTGDFANIQQNPCFGEKWMRMGTISSPGGCIAFVGPSDLHTKTNLNNTISSGMFSSILDLGERCFGASILAGKVELYRNYPLDLASDGYVSFYYHVYNALSDPSLNMWMLVPNTIPQSVIESGLTYAQSASHIRINASNLNGAIVSGTKNNIDFTYAKVQNGYALLPIDPEQTGNLTVTITKPDYVPLVATLTPSENPGVGIISNSLANQILNPGQNYTLNLTLKNYSADNLTNTPVTLNITPDSLITNLIAPSSITLNAGQQTNVSFTFTVASDALYGSILHFDFSVPAAGSNAQFDLQTAGPVFNITCSYTNGLNIGSSTTVNFTVQNIGTAPVQNAVLIARSLTDAAYVSTESVNLGNLEINASAQFQLTVNVEADCFIGRNIPLVFSVSDAGGYIYYCYYTLTAGNPSVTDPTGPDEYGYYAYDNYDTAYLAHPTYSWLEIDPAHGGPANAQVRQYIDDSSYVINLPFSFRYYGIDYNQLTICTNGWVSFGATWMTDFNNLYIPAPLGPYAQVSVYWDDLKGMKTGEDSLGSYFNNMRLITWHDTVSNKFYVEWNDAYNNYNIDLLQNASLEKFQLILIPRNNDDGDLIFQYHTVDNPAVTNNYSTVGIENHLQNGGLLYSYANIYPVTAHPLEAGLAIKFTTVPPDNYTANEDDCNVPVPVSLKQNYPNPFRNETSFGFTANMKSEVNLAIYNLKGQLVRYLPQGILAKGSHQIIWDGKDNKGNLAPDGVYIYKLTAAGQTLSRKMIKLN
ncbi:MAG TPA: C25 family cysteine peptidase [Candidatus Cloacimonadota bacterium]|nr:C25 family cysteine peptidase [Candidatus Cloacimonadota bacterium]HQL15240.1 C25 family cysteine peptidase [Candidatus Cloacimonadota bacterium]